VYNFAGLARLVASMARMNHYDWALRHISQLVRRGRR